ncbi:MAG: hypothetical protein D6694_00660, partial [Gammaproteobacteria bacterium]
ALPGRVTIPAGRSSVTIPVQSLPGARPGRTVELELDPSPSYGIRGTSSSTLALQPLSASASGDDGDGNSGSGGSDVLPFLGTAGAVGSALLLGGDGGAAACSADMPPALQAIALGQRGEPDWGRITFASARVQGRPASSLYSLSDFEGQLDDVSFGRIQRMSRRNAEADLVAGAITLSDWGVRNTTLAGLSNTLYADAEKIGDVKGLAEWISEQTGLPVSDLKGMSLDDMAGDRQLARLDLGDMPVNELPGFEDITLGSLPQDLAIDQIPGLADMPLSELFSCLADGGNVNGDRRSRAIAEISDMSSDRRSGAIISADADGRGLAE